MRTARRGGTSAAAEKHLSFVSVSIQGAPPGFMKPTFTPKAVPKPRKSLPKLCRPNDDGKGAVYVVIHREKKGRWHCTKELVKGLVFADFDKDGNCLGVEVVR